jgi:hypothetical protein
MMLLGDVREVQEVGKGASQRDRCVDGQLAELGRQRLKVAIGSGPRGFGDGAHTLDRLEEPRALVLAERFTQQFAEEADILS